MEHFLSVAKKHHRGDGARRRICRGADHCNRRNRGNVEGAAALRPAEGGPPIENEVRLTFGRWLAVALELELGADILNTAVTPTWTDIGKLAAIATLRTALNYFLEREIAEESKLEQQAAEQKDIEPHWRVDGGRLVRFSNWV